MKRALISVLAVLALVAAAAAQDTTAATPITQVPYRPTLLFIPVHVELFGRGTVTDTDTGASQKSNYFGIGAGIMAGYQAPLKWLVNLSYENFPAGNLAVESISSLSFITAQVGLRYFPSLPTFGFGRFPVRLTFSAQAGASMLKAGDWTPQVKPAATLSAGLAFSYADNPFGLMIEFVYHPLKQNINLEGMSVLRQAHLELKPEWGIRFTWMFSGGMPQQY